MFGINEHIFGILDTKNEVYISNTISLENVRSYSVSFYVKDVEAAGLPSNVASLSVEVVGPVSGLNADAVESAYPTIVPADDFSELIPYESITPLLWEDTYTLNGAAPVMSDSGFGYKKISCTMSIDSATAAQFLVIAVLHTTTLK